MKTEKKPFYGIKDGHLKFTVKDVDTSSRTVCAIANTCNYLDSDRDVLMSGCFDDSLKQRGVDSKAPDKIVHALFHDLTRLPGKIKTLEMRDVDGMDCLYMESKLTDTVDGNDTLKNYLAEIYNQHSIGFRYSKYDFINREAHGNSKQWEKLVAELINPDAAAEVGMICKVTKVDLWECSTVAFGANSLTPCIGMKSINKDAVMFEYFSRLDKLTTALKTGTQSDSMMHTLELQVMQLKQSFAEICEQFKLKSVKDIEDIIDELDCDNCGYKGTPEQDGECKVCHQQMKSAEPTLDVKEFDHEKLVSFLS